MESSDITASRILKCAISCLIYGGSFLLRAGRRLVGAKAKASCVILYYHSVPPEQRAQFAYQLDSILRWTKPISFKNGVHLLPGARHSSITFDDAFENFVSVALPELQKRNICCTMFVIVEALGKTFGPSGHAEPVMSQQQLLGLPQDLVTIGSHTLTHPMLTRIKEDNARAEIVRSRFELERIMQRKISLFSFPFGDFNERLVGVCREAGYERVFTTLPSFALLNPPEFAMGRVRVDPTDWPLEFRLKLAGAYSWLPFAFAVKRRIQNVVRPLSGAQRTDKA